MTFTESSYLVNETRRREPTHARCYCVATAAAVATVVGGVAAAGSAAYSAYESNKASKVAGRGNSADLYGKKIKPTEFKTSAVAPTFDSVSGASDYLAMLPDLRRIANQVTAEKTRLRNQVMPGSSEIMSQAGADLIALGRGQVAPDVVSQTNRIVAERAGGTFNPSNPNSYAGGAASTVNDFSRNIGKTSDENVNRFLSAAPTWEQLADQFAYSPDEAMGAAMDLLKTKFEAQLGGAELQLKMDEDRYSAGLNINRTLAAPNPEVVGSQNDMLLRQAMSNISGGKGNYLTAINGVVGGLSGALSGYSQLKVAGQQNYAAHSGAVPSSSGVSGVPAYRPIGGTAYTG